MSKKIYYSIFVFAIAILGFSSCEPEYEKEYNWAYPVSGEWTVNITTTDGEFVYGPLVLKTYNSSFGTDSIWVDDNGTWPLKAKAKVTMGDHKFANTNPVVISGSSPKETVMITKGQVVQTDSIYLEAVFDTDSEVTYVYSGHRRTSYEEYHNQDGAK